MKRINVIWIFAAMMFCISASFADDPPGQATKTLDDALLDDLENDLLQGLDDFPIKDTVPSRDAGDGDNAGSDRDRELLRQLGEGEDIGKPAEDPLTSIGRQMRRVEDLIMQRNTSESTQRMQQEIVDELAQIIEKLQKQTSQNQSSKPSGSPKPGNRPGDKKSNGDGAAKPGNKPARESTDRIGKSDADANRLEEMRRMLKEVWGHLPPRVREQMQSGSVERFLPKYEKLIEDYYKRLAEEPASPGRIN